ncbi:hypothetical protein ACF065_33800 [Streptomyces sp. NPDC015232]|uniref:hypothetical protein n=1 Tax=unclassified Streptomyces TaxID=2593676 RepID=UPI0036F5E3E7
MTTIDPAAPPKIFARYLTVAGSALADPALAVHITVDVTDSRHPESGTLRPGRIDMWSRITCTGCHMSTQTYGGNDYDQEDRESMSAYLADKSRSDAQTHAEKCRAMPGQ